MADTDYPHDDGIVEEGDIADHEADDPDADQADARTRRRMELSPVMTAAAVGGLSAAGIAVAVILGRRFLKRRQERDDE